MEYFAEYKNIKKMNIFLFVSIFFLVLFASPIFCAHANEENKNAKEQEIDDGIRFLEFENHTLLPKGISGFVTVKDKDGELYYSVQSQMPGNAYLLDIYVPQAYKQTLDREYYEDITHMVYLYTMPLLLPDLKALQNSRLSVVSQSIESVLANYKVLARPTLETQVTWENNVYELFMAGESVYFRYPKGVKNYKYSMLQTFPLTENRYTGAFLSTHIFVRGNQIYFLSASTFLTGSNYYEELMWTRNTLDQFIKLLPEPKREEIVE